MEVAWSVYQKMISAYRHTDLAKGKRLMSRLIGKIATGVPAGIEEIARLGRTLKRRREDILAYFDHRARPTGPPKPSTVAWSTYSASPKDPATSPTTQPAASSTQEASDTN